MTTFEAWARALAIARSGPHPMPLRRSLAGTREIEREEIVLTQPEEREQ